MRLLRLASIWSPAVVTAGMAVFVWQFGRDDSSVTVFLCVLTLAIVAHTYYLILEHHKRHPR